MNLNSIGLYVSAIGIKLYSNLQANIRTKEFGARRVNKFNRTLVHTNPLFFSQMYI